MTAAHTRAGALAGLRVVELTSTLMGPYCTMLLAQWGANVIKVEPPGGDPARYIGDMRDTGMGPFFLSVNRGKRGVVLDLRRPAASERLAALISWSDVFVHSLRPDSAREIGLDAEDILRINPGCVAVAFRGFAPGGPAADEPAYDDTIQARSGLAALQGAASEPTYVKSALTDKIVGVYGAAMTLAAVRQRDHTGRGVAIDVPMFETMVGFNLLEQQAGLVFDPPTGAAGYGRTSSPYRRPFRTRDGALSVLIYTDRHWRSFFDLIGRPELADSPQYRNIRERTQHIDELYRLVDEHMVEHTTAEWLTLLGERKIPVAPINQIEDLFTDPQLQTIGFFQQVQHPSEGQLVLPRIVGPTGDDPPPQRSWAPLLGADTESVFAEIAANSRPHVELEPRGA